MINYYHYHLYRNLYFDQILSMEDQKTGREIEALFAELLTAFEVVDDDEHILANRIGAFFLKETKTNRKEVELLLRDGSRRSMGWGSLSQVRRQCPGLFVLANRYCLVNRLYIKHMCRLSGNHYGGIVLDIPNSEPIQLSRRAYHELSKTQVEILN